MTPGAVDDFLGLLARDLSRVRTLVLHGRSGSGKSTLLRHVLRVGAVEFGGDPVVLDARPMRWEEARGLRDRTVLVDEVLELREVRHVAGLVARGCRVLVASHVGPWAYWPLRPFGPVLALATDRDPAKLARYLAARGIRASPEVLRDYTRRYGATYTDLEIILERCPGDELGASLARFERLHRIQFSSELR